MITLKSCPVCDSQSIVRYSQSAEANSQLTYEILTGVNINVTILVIYLICQDCHLIFQNPRLSDNKLDKYYADGYYRRTITAPPGG